MKNERDTVVKENIREKKYELLDGNTEGLILNKESDAQRETEKKHDAGRSVYA